MGLYPKENNNFSPSNNMHILSKWMKWMIQINFIEIFYYLRSRIISNKKRFYINVDNYGSQINVKKRNVLYLFTYCEPFFFFSTLLLYPSFFLKKT
jgi:hypothetical protein